MTKLPYVAGVCELYHPVVVKLVLVPREVATDRHPDPDKAVEVVVVVVVVPVEIVLHPSACVDKDIVVRVVYKEATATAGSEGGGYDGCGGCGGCGGCDGCGGS